jgi:DMSO reductase anchor subunit
VASVLREKFWAWYCAALVPVVALVALPISDRMRRISDIAISQSAPEDVLGFGWTQQLVLLAVPCLLWLPLFRRAWQATKTRRHVLLCVVQLLVVVAACSAAAFEYRALEQRVFHSAYAKGRGLDA